MVTRFVAQPNTPKASADFAALQACGLTPLRLGFALQGTVAFAGAVQIGEVAEPIQITRMPEAQASQHGSYDLSGVRSGDEWMRQATCT
jgi:hypothetical protein